MSDNNSRFERYMGLVKPEQLQAATVAVVGTGAVGRQAALILAEMGVGRLILVDHDVVERPNLGPQGWLEMQVGMRKVEALAGECLERSAEIQLISFPERFKPEHLDLASHVMLCVDNMDVRKVVVEASSDRPHITFLADGRMGAEVCEAHFINDPVSFKAWVDGWFPPNQAAELPCTMRATRYCAGVAASLMVSGLSQQFRQMELPFSVAFSLLGLTLEVNRRPDQAPVPDPVPAAD